MVNKIKKKIALLPLKFNLAIAKAAVADSINAIINAGIVIDNEYIVPSNSPPFSHASK